MGDLNDFQKITILKFHHYYRNKISKENSKSKIFRDQDSESILPVEDS